MRISSRAIWVIGGLVLLLLVVPLPLAERYTSPTQDGQYILNPLKAYRFVIDAVRVSPDSQLNTSGKALVRAKEEFPGELRPTKVELLFLPEEESYTYTTESGTTLALEDPETFVWEVWGVREPASTEQRSKASAEVIGFLSYKTGEVLASDAQ